MPYSIHEEEGFVEVKVWDKTSIWDVLSALWELRRRDPHKKICDLWSFASGCVIPLVAFPKIIGMVLAIVPRDKSGCRSALVVSDEIQMAEAQIYLHEARNLPFEIKAFLSRTSAVEWLKSGKSLARD